MPRSKKKTSPTAPVSPTPVPDERWTTVQVASFLSIPYQTARNNMLAGDYGASDYIAETRTLLVSASAVRAWKEKHGQKRKLTSAKKRPSK